MKLRIPISSLRSSAWAFSFILALAGSATGQQSAEAKQPNVLFILCDDLGFGDVGVFFQNEGAGDREPRVNMLPTPHLDELAAEGVQLRGHYCPAPVCAPSRASLLLGVHQGHSNVRDNQFDKELENNHTLASMLKQAGYRTVCIGKWGLQGEDGLPAHPQKRGFDEYFGYISHKAGHAHYPKENRKTLYDGTEQVREDYDKCYTTDLFTARAKKFIVEHRNERKDQPFFLYLAFDTPHAKTQIPSSAYPEGGGLQGGLQWLGKPGKMINTAEGKIDSWYYPEHAEATWDDPKRPGKKNAWPDVAKRYATMVRRIDDCVYDLVTTLRDLDIERNTLVIFTSDNGPSKESYLKGKDEEGYSRNFDPGFFRGYGPFDGIKRDCFEGGVRVGAIVRWPGKVLAGKVSERPSQFHDWMPTFAELANVPAPARTDGVSLVPELTGEGTQADSTVYVEYTVGGKTPNKEDFLPSRRNHVRKQMQVLRVGDFVGVRYNIKSHEDDFEIYDVIKDPAQRNDLASGMKDLQQQMKDRVLQIRRPNPTAKRPYDSVAVPAAPPTGATVPGIEVRTYAVQVPWPVDDRALPTVTSGILPSPKLPASANGEAQAVVFRGWIRVPEEGEYTFSLPENSQAVMKLHEATVIDVGGEAGSDTGSIRLQAGVHPIFLSVLTKKGSPDPVLAWSSKSMPMAPVPADHFMTLAQ